MFNRIRNNNQPDCARQIDLINTFLKLWEQHIMWTRSLALEMADLMATGIIKQFYF